MSATRTALLACAPQTRRGSPVQLSADPKGQNFVYTNGRTVIVRQFKDPSLAWEYTEHTTQATVARFAPSGFYVASGDVAGNVRIWDVTQETHLLKYETRALSGRINDLTWDVESKRIIAVGDGKERFGHAFLFDSGSSVGEISGHSKTINAVSVRSVRPFRAVTCSDDMTVNFYHGVPYKFALSISDHSRFVHCARFSTDGAHFATAGADAKIFLYDGATGAKIKEVTSSSAAHQGGIFSLSWSPDSKQFLTSSADMTAKLWDVETSQIIQTFQFSDSPTVDDQQVGNLWQGEYLMSLSLSGTLNYLDVKQSKPVRTLQSHAKAITALTASGKDDQTFFSGSYDGRVYRWSGDYASGEAVEKSPSNQISALVAVPQQGSIASVSMDDTLRLASVVDRSFSDKVYATEAVPKALALVPTAPSATFAVATLKEIRIVRDYHTLSSFAISYTPLSLAVSPEGRIVAVGADDNKVYVYSIDSNSGVLKSDPVQVLDSNRGGITALTFSPDGSLLVAGDSSRVLLAYDTANWQVKINQWAFHTARINAIAFTSDGRHCATGSLDTHIYIWSVAKPMKRIQIKNAHTEAVNGLVFIKDDLLASVGQDGCIRLWNVVFHE